MGLAEGHSLALARKMGRGNVKLDIRFSEKELEVVQGNINALG